MADRNGARLLKIGKAASLKARGATWDEIARALGYSSGRSASLALRRDRELWDEQYLRAINARLREDAEPLALAVQSNIASTAAAADVKKLDAALVKVAQAAAQSLLAHVARFRAADRPQPPAAGIDPQVLEEIKSSASQVLEAAAMMKRLGVDLRERWEPAARHPPAAQERVVLTQPAARPLRPSPPGRAHELFL